MGWRNNPKAAFSLDQILRHNDRIIGRPDHIARIHFQIILLRRQQHRTVLEAFFVWELMTAMPSMAQEL